MITMVLQVGDHQSLLQSLKDSPYYPAFADRARVWEQRLADLDEYLSHLNMIQVEFAVISCLRNDKINS